MSILVAEDPKNLPLDDCRVFLKSGGRAGVTGASLNTGLQAIYSNLILLKTNLESELFALPTYYQVRSTKMWL